MLVEFLHRDPSNTRLILIFTGWSASPSLHAEVSMPGWDVAVAYNFSDLSFDSSLLDDYYTVYLFAWSLGVFAADCLLPPERITAAFAINGTLHPVDDTRGIPSAIYNGTEQNLSPASLRKFRRRMVSDSRTFADIFGNADYSDSAVESLRVQLQNIRTAQHNEGADQSISPRIDWLRAYIADSDHIFPPANMTASWAEYPDTEIISLVDSPHYVNLASIVRSVISDTTNVGQKFAKASSTYDSHAIAQRSIAIRLANMLRAYTDIEGSDKVSDILEIGCGTGLFTREYARFLLARSATFVDVSPCGPFGLFDNEEYLCCDAEKWLEKSDRKFDFILSTSAIQWFADIPAFLRRCYDCLAPGGILAISTFLPGNLRELDEVRPSPIIYPKLEMLQETLGSLFYNAKIVTDSITIEFRSVREMLMHLKHTGVAGSAPGSSRTLADYKQITRLTYTPVYLLARK